MRPSERLRVLVRKASVVGRIARAMPSNRKSSPLGGRRIPSEKECRVGYGFVSCSTQVLVLSSGHLGLSVKIWTAEPAPSSQWSFIFIVDFICSVDYPWPESRDWGGPSSATQVHRQIYFLFWEWVESQFPSKDLTQKKMVLCWGSPVFPLTGPQKFRKSSSETPL